MTDKDLLIVKTLTEAEDGFVSGSQLAEEIGVSRVSVWSYMEKLKTQGFDFEAIRGKGYRLTQRPDNLNANMTRALLPRSAADLNVHVLGQVDSTNTEAERRLANGAETPFAIFASEQTKGRGRLGRVWHSPENGNLYLSFAFRPQVSPARLSLFTIWMGLNICECINALTGAKSGLKWPNDLHVDGKKICGILTEARMEAELVRDIVLGVGLNLNGGNENWPDELKDIATSLRQVTGQRHDPNKVAATLAGRLMLAYKQFLDDEHKDAIAAKWPQYDVLKGRSISVMQGQNRIVGTANGIDSSGSLIIERENGTRYLARAGEVSIEKASHAKPA